MSRRTITSSASAGMPGMPEPARPLAFVHVAAGGQRVVLAVLGQRDAEARGVLEGAAHEPRVLHAGAVVGEEAHAERRHLRHRRQLLAGAADGDGTGDVDVAQRGGAELQHLAHDGGAVDRRLGVRHGDDRGVAAERGGPRAGLDRLGLLAARLAQVGVQVDEAGADDAPAGVEHRAWPSRSGADRGDDAVARSTTSA